MFINIAICDKDKDRIQSLRNILTNMSIKHDCEVQLFWLFGSNMKIKLEELSDSINMALISMDIDETAELGKCIYKINPDCYIMYYKQQPGELEPLLFSRPIAFHQGAQDDDAFSSKVLRIWTEIWSRGDLFRYQSRNLACLLPYGSITYFESDYKNVKIHTSSGKVFQIYSKLDAVESELEKGLFLRVHKSFLVNISYIDIINKTNHCIHLRTGETLSISKAHYERTTEALLTFQAEN